MSTEPSAFAALGLPPLLLKALRDVGYETPSPIQAQCIPFLMDGKDLVGQAQTGTGKTAAFALPLLSRVNNRSNSTQIMVLTPTRELAIQVAEACQSYAKHMKGFHVLPIYGGQSYSTQLRQLKRGVQVVVGTPGRVMDHMRKGTLKLDGLQSLVLDEADEMLRMGFIDDVEWVLEHTPDDCQVALFSATMPKVIRRVAQQYLTDPEEVKIEAKTTTASTITQRYLQIHNAQKLDGLTRILDAESFDGVIIFVRTKTATTELADKLTARGFAADALNGDIPQNRREQIVNQLKAGKLDILVATDVVARGLDVERISHVINYDIPYDTESYVHRIGRTGRAGRTGDAILFVTSRERRLLSAIEKTTRQRIEKMHLPGTGEINEKRIARFKQSIRDVSVAEDLSLFQQLLAELQQEDDMDMSLIAAALAHMSQGNKSLLVEDLPDMEKKGKKRRDDDRKKPKDGDRKRQRESSGPGERSSKASGGSKALPLKEYPDIKMQRYRIDVGYDHEVKPGNIVGAIANEADIESCYIGHIEIYDDYSTVDLPDGMPDETFKSLRKARVCQRKLNIEAVKAEKPTGKTAGKPPRSSEKLSDKPRKPRKRKAKKQDGNQ